MISDSVIEVGDSRSFRLLTVGDDRLETVGRGGGGEFFELFPSILVRGGIGGGSSIRVEGFVRDSPINGKAKLFVSFLGGRGGRCCGLRNSFLNFIESTITGEDDFILVDGGGGGGGESRAVFDCAELLDLSVKTEQFELCLRGGSLGFDKATSDSFKQVSGDPFFLSNSMEIFSELTISNVSVFNEFLGNCFS